jgi:hypothetical protein
MDELMNNELGDTLEALLKKFPDDDTVFVEDILVKDMSYTQELLCALEQRGFVKSYQERYSPESIDRFDEYRITVEGRNYLELHRRWWQRYMVKSVYIPMAVAFVTALITSLSTFALSEAATRLAVLLQMLLLLGLSPFSPS